MKKNVTPTVDAMSNIDFVGNVIPHLWYSHIVVQNKRGCFPYLEAIVILSDLVYWYRPQYVTDEFTGKLIHIKNKFSGDKLQRNYNQLSEEFGFSYKIAREAVKFLEEKCYITLELRDVKTKNGVLQNVMYIDLVPKNIQYITTQIPHLGNSPLPNSYSTDCPFGQSAIAQMGGTYTEIITKNTNKEYSSNLADFAVSSKTAVLPTFLVSDASGLVLQETSNENLSLQEVEVEKEKKEKSCAKKEKKEKVANLHNSEMRKTFEGVYLDYIGNPYTGYNSRQAKELNSIIGKFTMLMRHKQGADYNPTTERLCEALKNVMNRHTHEFFRKSFTISTLDKEFDAIIASIKVDAVKVPFNGVYETIAKEWGLLPTAQNKRAITLKIENLHAFYGYSEFANTENRVNNELLAYIKEIKGTGSFKFQSFAKFLDTLETKSYLPTKKVIVMQDEQLYK